MKIPAIRGVMGGHTFYITTLTFQQVNDYISKVDDELHSSDSLKNLIQRSITNNYKSIKEYILNQPEMFFNSLVLAVYNNYPTWQEVELSYDNDEHFNMGILSFSGQHKIFPVDGQHRVEGIKAALETNPNLSSNQIGAIFIGHQNDEEGMQKTRRVFTTLNRYAKRVSDRDIIALDEDDCVAIVTRELVENYDLFKQKRVVDSLNKAIPSNNKDAITSIITLYQCNIELCKLFYKNKFGRTPSKSKFNEYLKFRPEENELQEFRDYILGHWNSFSRKMDSIVEYKSLDSRPAENYRSDNGGNLLFRPVGILPFIKAVAFIKSMTALNYDSIYQRFNDLNLELNSVPWKKILWNDLEHKMIMNSSTLTKLMLIYLYDSQYLNESEIEKLKLGYATKLNIEDPVEIENVLNNIN